MMVGGIAVLVGDIAEMGKSLEVHSKLSDQDLPVGVKVCSFFVDLQKAETVQRWHTWIRSTSLRLDLPFVYRNLWLKRVHPPQLPGLMPLLSRSGLFPGAWHRQAIEKCSLVCTGFSA